MNRTGWGMLGGVFAVALSVSFALIQTAMHAGVLPPAAPWITLTALAVLAVALLLRGRGVKRLVAHEETETTALGAARTLVLAKTSSLVGAIIGGFFGAQLLIGLTHPPAPIRGDLLLSSIVGLVVCVGLVVIAMLVEGWCRIDPPSSEDTQRGGASPAGA